MAAREFAFGPYRVSGWMTQWVDETRGALVSGTFNVVARCEKSVRAPLRGPTTLPRLSKICEADLLEMRLRCCAELARHLTVHIVHVKRCKLT